MNRTDFVNDVLDKYKGNYIKEMRKNVGHAPLMGTSCGVIIENDKGEILLQKRRDNSCWAILGGSMEIGEKFTEAARREVFEEAGIKIGKLELFGIYSGEDRIIIYPNGDICYGVGVVFKTTVYSGIILNDTDEALEHRFFGRESIPGNLNYPDKRIIMDWVTAPKQPIIN